MILRCLLYYKIIPYRSFRRGRVYEFTLPQQRHLRGRCRRLHLHLQGWMEGQNLYSSRRTLRTRYLSPRWNLPRSRRWIHLSLSTRLGGSSMPHSISSVREQSLRERSHLREHCRWELQMRLSRRFRGSELPSRRRRLPAIALLERG